MSKKIITPEELEARRQQLKKELGSLNDIEHKIAANTYYEQIKDKYEGKFFVYENASSLEKKWLMYIKVVTVIKSSITDKDRFSFNGFAFQTAIGYNGLLEPSCELLVKSDRILLKKPISEAKFDEAYRKWQHKIYNITKMPLYYSKR